MPPLWTDTGAAARIDGGPWFRVKVESPRLEGPAPMSLGDWMNQTPADRDRRHDLLRSFVEDALSRLEGNR